MSRATEFLAWLIEDTNTVCAEAGTPRDDQLKQFEADGFLHLAGTFHGTNEYEISNKGAVGWMDRS